MAHPTGIRTALIAALLALVALAPAQSPTGPAVVASTSWTGAIAAAAGLEDVTVLAPADMQHPPEYALAPSDLLAASRADILIYAGYESFVPRLLQATENEDATLLQVTTENDPDVLAASARAVAKVAGTLPAFERWEASFRADFQTQAARLAAAPDAGRVVAHAMMLPQVQALGMHVVGTFGPAPLTPSDIAELRRARPTLIVDNGHAPLAGSLVANSDARSVAFINFPGTDGTSDVIDVVRRNVDLVLGSD